MWQYGVQTNIGVQPPISPEAKILKYLNSI